MSHPFGTFRSKGGGIENRSDDLQKQMTIAVLDWFLLEGGEPIYERGPDDEGEVHLDFCLFEVRMPEFEVFVGPPTEDGPWVVEVAVSVRPHIALAVDTVEALLEPFAARLPARHQIDVFATEDFGSDSAVWLATRLTPSEVDSVEIDKILVELLTEARAMQAHLAN